MAKGIKGHKKMKGKKKALIIIGVFFVLLIFMSYLYHIKLRPMIMAREIYKHKGHVVFEYHVDFNTLDNDEEEGFIKSLGKGSDGFAIIDRDGKKYKGSFYNGDSYDPYITFYKEKGNIFINLKDIITYMIGRIDKKKRTKIYEHISDMDDCYITVKQLKELFGINVNEIKIDWEKIIKEAIHFMPCDPPKDYHTSIDVSEYDFYHIYLEDENKDVIFGIPKGIRPDEKVMYISVVSNTMRFEMFGYYEFNDDVHVKKPQDTVSDDTLNEIKEKYDFVKNILEFLH